jgi:uncharacterized membrane protein
MTKVKEKILPALKKVKDFFSKISLFCAKNKKIIIICLLILLCSYLSFLASRTQIMTRDVDVLSTSDVKPYVTQFYHIAGNKYSPLNSDPQMYFYGTKEVINDISIKLSAPLSENTSCQLFYASGEIGLSEQNSIWFYATKGTTEIYFTVPERVYDIVRIDINGEFELESVSFSMVENSSPRLKTKVNFPVFIVLILIIASLATIYFLYSKKIDSSVLKIKDSWFSTEFDEDFSKRTALKTANIFTFIAIIAGFMLVFIMPPLSVADEQAHFLNVLKISHFDLLPSVHEGSIGTFLTMDEVTFLKKYNSAQNIHMSFSELFKGYSESKFKTQFFASSYVTLNPFPYLIPGMAVAIARAMFERIDVYSLLIIARLANLTVAILLTRYALKITPAFRNSMFLLALMPMTLHQFASTSYDALLIPASFVLFAYIVKLITASRDYRISIKDIVVICLCFSVIFAAKPVYATVALLFLAVSFKKFGTWKKYVSCIALLACCAVTFYFIPVWINTYALSSLQSAVSMASVETGGFVFNMKNINSLVDGTVNYFSDDWKLQFFGVLGWLRIYLPKAFSEIFYVILALSVIVDACQIKGINIRARILSYVSLYIFSVALIVNAFINWNPALNMVGKKIAYGIQGRYFIPIMIFTFIIFGNPLLTKFKHRKQIAKVSCGVASITGILCAMLTLFAVTAFYWF